MSKPRPARHAATAPRHHRARLSRRRGPRPARHRCHREHAKPRRMTGTNHLSRHRPVNAARATNDDIPARRQDRPHRRHNQRRNNGARTRERNHARHSNTPDANAPRNDQTGRRPPDSLFHCGEGPAVQCPETRRAATKEPGLARAGGDPATVKRQGGTSDERTRVASELAAT
jgi:hypothetical protein